MPILFDDEEKAYLDWIAENPHGFVVNIDRQGHIAQYPMIHTASHRLLSSDKIGRFTTGDYVKVCCSDREKLEGFCEREYGKKVTTCASCFPA